MNFSIKPSEIEALSQLARAPSTLKAIEDAHAKSVANRTALNKRIEELDKQAEIDWPRRQEAIAATAKKVRAAERSLRDANEALAKAHTESFNASQTYTRERQSAELALIDGADSATIAAWKNDLLNELDALGRPSVIIRSQTVERSEVTRKEIRNGFSNIKSIHARMAAVRASYETADELKLVADQRKLPAIIAEIRASWPLVDQNPQPTKVTP